MTGGGRIIFRSFIAGLLAAFLACALPTADARAQLETGDDQPALISADRVTYDEALEVVTASGNVEVSQNDRTLLADSLSYNMRSDVVTASGNVSLLEPDGEVIFADYAEMTGDLREGAIRGFKVLMTDGSRLAAASGQRVGGRRSQLRKAVFSPCEVCEEDPSAAPLWQLKADKVIHDQVEKTISYRDATFEVWGVPIAYTPYFSHPDPTVKRKSGFLAPTFGGSDSLGSTVQIPYFWAISPDKDLTFEPIFTSNQSVVAAGGYRQLLPDGELDLAGSATLADRQRSNDTIEEDAFRGHVDAQGNFDINETWRWGFDLNRSTDDTYLRLYNFSSERTLTSRAFVEGFRGRNYMAVNGFAYQGLRAVDNNEQQPVVLPMMDYNFVSQPGGAGGIYNLDANMVALHREEGRESRRASLRGGWTLPYYSPIGEVYSLTAQLQADGYWVEGYDPDQPSNVDPRNGGDTFFTGRVFPQLALQWRYPWISEGGGWQQTIEPVVQGVAAPANHMNPGEIPNEDSQDFELDDTNLLSLNRFNGLDRVDPGSRVDYGMKWSLVTPSGITSTAFIGQSYRFSEDVNFQEGSGLEDKASDIVGRLEFQPSQYVTTRYRFRLDKDSLEPLRNELDLALGPPALNLQLNYLDLGLGSSNEEFANREELTVRLRSRMTEYWSAFVGHRRNLETDDSLSTQVGLTYQDECFLLDVIAERSGFEDREIEPEDSIFLRIGLKHLGQFGTS